MGRKKAGGTVPPVTLPIAKWAEAERGVAAVGPNRRVTMC